MIFGDIIEMAKAGLGNVQELLKLPENVRKSLMDEYKKNLKSSQSDKK